MKKMLSVLGIVLVLTVSGWTSSAEAVEQRTRGRDPNDMRRSHITSVHHPVHYVRRLPAGCRKLRVANVVYYLWNGVFFRSTPFGYQVVSAPCGVVFRTLPSGTSRVRIGKTTYFVCDNTYFIRKPAGYVVASPPHAAFL